MSDEFERSITKILRGTAAVEDVAEYYLKKSADVERICETTKARLHRYTRRIDPSVQPTSMQLLQLADLKDEITWQVVHLWKDWKSPVSADHVKHRFRNYCTYIGIHWAKPWREFLLEGQVKTLFTPGGYLWLIPMSIWVAMGEKKQRELWEAICYIRPLMRPGRGLDKKVMRNKQKKAIEARLDRVRARKDMPYEFTVGDTRCRELEDGSYLINDTTPWRPPEGLSRESARKLFLKVFFKPQSK